MMDGKSEKIIHGKKGGGEIPNGIAPIPSPSLMREGTFHRI